MTATWSQVAATMPRSWVMRMMERPVRSRSSSSSRRIWACTVTSSAVVGSSAMSRRGSQAMRRGDHGALAHPAAELMGDRHRHCAPDRGCRPGAAGRSPSAAPRARTCPGDRSAAPPPGGRWSSADRDGWRGSGRSWRAGCRGAGGARPPAGPAGRAPRTSRSRSAMRARLLGSRRRIERQATVLPEPLSPTIPSTSPSSSSKETWSTAPQGAAGRVTNSTERSATSSKAIVLIPSGPASRRSRRASKLKPVASSMMARPGKTVIHQAVAMKVWPSAIISAPFRRSAAGCRGRDS